MIDILQGDCMQILPTLPAQSVQCCVTSPPYFGLRDYGTAKWEGGDHGCDHLGEPFRTSANINANWGAGFNDVKNSTKRQPFGSECAKCGAHRIDSQLGLEPTPEEYVAKMVAVFREVWRVLRDDGTLWVNLGDSYCSTTPGTMGDRMGNLGLGDSAANARRKFRPDTPQGLKPKDICGIPWRVAFALQADGWYLRSDIIWHKPNPMPESVTDRPTKSHEYIFLLSKSAKYYYDADAIREPSIGLSEHDLTGTGYSAPGQTQQNGNRTQKRPPLEGSHGTLGMDGNGMRMPEKWNNSAGRNKRSVWTIPTQPYSEAHFATFPEDLIKPCIMAGSRLGDTVLDPFGGSGTTGRVAIELGRRAILIELNPAYVEMSKERTNVTHGML
jgi:DNA modification methylase